jgi:hypothetical protein
MKQKPTAKRTSSLADLQEVLAEPFPGAVAQGGVLVFSDRFQTIMKQWVGNAHGDQPVRGMWEKRVGRFDFCGDFLDHHRKGGVF